MARRPETVTPNRLLQDARRRLPSPTRADRSMSPVELATAVNLLLHSNSILDADIDASYISKLEAGKYRWPRNERRRWALRTVLGVTSDAELGFSPNRHSVRDADRFASQDQPIGAQVGVQGEAAVPELDDVGAMGAMPGGRWAVTRDDRPNDLLTRARCRLTSPSGSGRVLSPQELAEAVNSYLWNTHEITENLDGTYVGHLEQGRYRWPKARRREAFRHVLRVTDDKEIGFYNPRGVLPSDLPRSITTVEEPESWHGEIYRRTMLRATIASAGWGLSATAMTLDDLSHIVAALDDSRRYLDSTIIGHLRKSLAQYAAKDGSRGPRAALPGVLGVLGVVEQRAKQVRPDVRRELLTVGARAAEFAGWLYRDAAMPQPADYWRDRATEWAMESGDHAMPGYILIKKSQSAWDARDALRMLTLAQAVQSGPWVLPARVRAEAMQQEARGIAMIDGNVHQASDKLRQAQEVLTTHRSTTPGNGGELAAHYDASLFAVQTAMCYTQAGQPERAVSVFDAALRPSVFSRRDFAYFLSQKGQALAAGSRADEAANAGCSALPIATASGSARTVGELVRLGDQLRPWADRPAVRKFHALLAA